MLLRPGGKTSDFFNSGSSANKQGSSAVTMLAKRIRIATVSLTLFKKTTGWLGWGFISIF
jgi:hypothetical protein